MNKLFAILFAFWLATAPSLAQFSSGSPPSGFSGGAGAPASGAYYVNGAVPAALSNGVRLDSTAPLGVLIGGTGTSATPILNSVLGSSDGATWTSQYSALSGYNAPAGNVTLTASGAGTSACHQDLAAGATATLPLSTTCIGKVFYIGSSSGAFTIAKNAGDTSILYAPKQGGAGVNSFSGAIGDYYGVKCVVSGYWEVFSVNKNATAASGTNSDITATTAINNMTWGHHTINAATYSVTDASSMVQLMLGASATANLAATSTMAIDRVFIFSNIDLVGNAATINAFAGDNIVDGKSQANQASITLAAGDKIILMNHAGNTYWEVLSEYTQKTPVANGGTGSSTAAGARTNLGAAASGANSDITSLSALATPLSVAQGGTGTSAQYTVPIIFGCASVATGGVTRYLYPGSNVANVAETQIIIPRAMTFTSININCTTAPGAAHTDSFTVRKNGVDTALTASLVNTATTGTLSGQSVAFAAGDKMSVKMVTAATTADTDAMVTVEGY